MYNRAECFAALVLVLGSASCAAVSRQEPALPSSDMVRIALGSYVTGIDSSEVPVLLARYGLDHPEIFAGEIPRRVVQVGAFWIDRNLITKFQYRSFLRSIPQWRKGAQPAGSNNGR